MTGCNLHQEATTIKTYLHLADAKPVTAADLPHSTHTDKLTSTVKGDVVTTRNPADYVNAGLEFTDNPGWFNSILVGTTDMLTNYRFVGDVYVEEANSIKGSIKMNANFDLNGYEINYTVRKD